MKPLKQIINEIDIIGQHKRTKAMHMIMHFHYNYENATHRAGIHNYNDSHQSKLMNGYLWEKHKDPEGFPHNETTETNIRKLDSAIHEFKTPHKLAVYSGTKHDPRELKNSEGIVHHPAYLSTSIDESVGNRFAGYNASKDNQNIAHEHVLKIHVPKGHPGVYVPSKGSNAFYDTEKEFILPRGTNLKHIKTETKEYPFSFKRKFIHHMKVV
jgi:hypothetical protein